MYVLKDMLRNNEICDKRVAIITGASQGLGREIAKRFSIGGYYVIINYKTNENAANETLNCIKEMGRCGCETYQCDISNFSQAEKFINDIYNKHTAISVLINNAGITEDAPIVTMKESQWDAVLSTNLKGVFNCCKAAAPIFMKQRDGCIITISSLSGVEGRAGQTNYSASKAAVIGFSKSLAKELSEFNCRVNVIIPGFMETEMTKKLTDSSKKNIQNRNLLPISITPKDAAEFVYFIAHQKCISGQVFHCDNRINA